MSAMKLKPLDQQVVVVTGASSGIGLATARSFAEQGARVLLIARNEDALAKICEELRSRGFACDFAVADVADETALKAAAEKCVQLFGGFDTWVNDAGVSVVGPVREVARDDMRRVFETNYWGVVHGSLIAVEHLRGKPQGGAVINIGSVQSDAPLPMQATYGASKHAVKGFTHALRLEMMRDQSPVSVTLIKPASIDTPLNEHARNLTEDALRMPPPVYGASVVAEAVLFAAQNRVRELTVGGAGAIMTGAIKALPPVFEPLAARFLPRFYRAEEKKRIGDDGLHESASDGRERTLYPKVRESSAWLKMQQKPEMMVAAGAGLGVVLGLLGLAGRMRAEKMRYARDRALVGSAVRPVVVRRRGRSGSLLFVSAAVAALGGAAVWAKRQGLDKRLMERLSHEAGRALSRVREQASGGDDAPKSRGWRMVYSERGRRPEVRP